MRIVRQWFRRESEDGAIERCARKLRDNLKFCRCYACRNPRWEGFPPLQELRAKEAGFRCDADEP